MPGTHARQRAAYTTPHVDAWRIHAIRLASCGVRELAPAVSTPPVLRRPRSGLRFKCPIRGLKGGSILDASWIGYACVLITHAPRTCSAMRRPFAPHARRTFLAACHSEPIRAFRMV